MTRTRRDFLANALFRSKRRRFSLCSAIVFFGFALGASGAELAPLTLKLPAPAFAGTPRDTPEGSNIEMPSDKPRPPLMVPKEVKNVAPGAKISCSDTNAQPGALAKITDGDKEGQDSSIVLLRKGTQYVQFDLGGEDEIYAIAIWHAHDAPKVYHDVVVQLSDDAGCARDVRTLFNNDTDNSSGRGAGTDREYYESYQGKLIEAKGAKARYVRLYSRGSTDSAMNEYTEVEIYARPAK